MSTRQPALDAQDILYGSIQINRAAGSEPVTKICRRLTDESFKIGAGAYSFLRFLLDGGLKEFGNKAVEEFRRMALLREEVAETTANTFQVGLLQAPLDRTDQVSPAIDIGIEPCQSVGQLLAKRLPCVLVVRDGKQLTQAFNDFLTHSGVFTSCAPVGKYIYFQVSGSLRTAPGCGSEKKGSLVSGSAQDVMGDREATESALDHFVADVDPA